MIKTILRHDIKERNFGIIGAIFYSLFGILLMLTGHSFVALGILSIGLTCCAAVIGYKRQIIIIEEEQLIFRYVLKKEQVIRYDDVSCLLLYPCGERQQKILLDHEYNRLITLNESFVKFEKVLDALVQHDIPCIDFYKFAEKKEHMFCDLSALTSFERNFINLWWPRSERAKGVRRK